MSSARPPTSISDELGYSTDRPYATLSLDVNGAWIWPSSPDRGFSQENTAYEQMSKNRFMKVWVLCGYYDMATPFYGAEWVYNHVFLNEETLPNLQFSYFPSGHMIYLCEPAIAAFRMQAEAWYAGT